MLLYVSEDFALNHVILRRHSRIVKLLLADSRVDINAKLRKGYTPLQIASRVDKIEFAQLLLNRDADFTVINNYNETACDCALHNGHSSIVTLLENAFLCSLSPLDRVA